MSATIGASPSPRHAALLVLLAILLAVAFFTFQYVIPARLVMLSAAGVLLCGASVVILAYPKLGLFLAVFYVYCGLTYYFKVNAGWPIVGLVVASVGLNLLRGDKLQRPASAFNWAAALFMVVVVQSFFFVWDVGYAMAETTRFLRALIMVLLIVHLLRAPRDLHRCVLLMFFSVFLTVVAGVLALKFGLVKEPAVTGGTGGWVRLASSHGDPNTLALYTTSAVPLGIYAMRRFHGWFPRVGVGLILLMLIVAAFSTFSRGAILPLGFVAIVILFRDARARYAVPILLLVVAVVALFTPLFYWDRLLSLGQLASQGTIDWSLRVRLDALKAAWKLFLAHPLTGAGMGNFVVSSPDLVVRKVAHNAYLEILVNVGIFGFAAYMSMLLVGLKEFVRGVRGRWTEEYQWMRHLAFYAMVAYVSALMGVVFLSMPFDYIIWLQLAIGLAAGQMARRDARGNNA